MEGSSWNSVKIGRAKGVSKGRGRFLDRGVISGGDEPACIIFAVDAPRRNVCVLFSEQRQDSIG